MDEDKIINKEKNIGMPVTGILKRKSRKAAMAAKKAAKEAAAAQSRGEKTVDPAEKDEAEQGQRPSVQKAETVEAAASSDHYHNGQAKFEDIDGQRIYYFMDGEIKARGSFDGRMQGEWQFFKNTNRLSQIGHYKDDVKDGKWLRFTDDGMIEKVQNFKDGELLKD